jgi:hypothetical protein
MTDHKINETWRYLHRVDYFRLGNGESRVLEHTERIADAGWCFRRAGMTRDEWLTYYTELCAHDFLTRARAVSGNWLVIVYQDRGASDQRLVCSIRLTYPGHDRVDAG